MKEYPEIVRISELSHDDIQALIERGRAERSAFIAASLKRVVKSLREVVAGWMTPNHARLRLRHH